ncbi:MULTISPECIES: hypothetical protein [unclassified Kitasatospora]|uniref:hypothetical protein n=1 Tax=unclassified Kitasatospora TaxID=2633591 RepID=UPI00071006BB|nr:MULTISPECIES: hypothetical protein [unclassified Kitasatospora]KQV20825.1 hypothetical protein ASC99_20155 [Kitasatospora sp. Root107]KRB60518.1 hypothetical protein ASE03_13020 [Kitasatospora sp. Root187]
MTRTRRRAAHDTGEEIWERVVATGEEGASMEEAKGDLTEAQWNLGKRWIKDYKCKDEEMSFARFRDHYFAGNEQEKSLYNLSDIFKEIDHKLARARRSLLEYLPPEAIGTYRVQLAFAQVDGILDLLDPMEKAGYSYDTAEEIYKHLEDEERADQPRAKSTKQPHGTTA